MEENKQVVAEWKALNQPRLQEIKKANPDLYLAVNLALQYLNQKLGGEELPAEIEVVEDVVETTPMSGKQWTLNDFINKKIVVDTREKSKNFQEFFFSLGGSWPNGRQTPFFYSDTSDPYLRIIADGKNIDTVSKTYFQQGPGEEIFYDDIFPSQTKTKQWTLDDFKNIKIIVDTPEKSRKFQELFLSLGGKWSKFDNKNPTEPANFDALYLVTTDSPVMVFYKAPKNFDKSQNKEIYYDDIFEVQKPTTSQSTTAKEYKLPIETYPILLKHNYPFFVANDGSRPSPTQSAGELKRSVMPMGTDEVEEIRTTKFRGNDKDWYEINVGKGGTWTWKKLDYIDNAYYEIKFNKETSSTNTQPTLESTSFTSTATSTAQPVAAPVLNYKPSDLLGKDIYYKGNYKIVQILKVNPKTVRYKISSLTKDIELDIPKSAIGSLLQGKVVGKAFLKDPVPVQTPVQTQTQSTTSNSFEDSITSLSDAELKQLYDDTYEARKEFSITEPEYLELSEQIVTIGNEIDNRNI